VFLNGRCVESAPLHYGLREGYHTTLMKGQYPVTFLFVTMDAHAYDVNVHPAKKEVRFYDGHAVREAVAHAVQETLNQSRVLPQGHATGRSPTPVPVPPLPIDTSVAVERQVVLPLPAVEQQALRRDWNELPARSESALPAPAIEPAAALASSPTTPPEADGTSRSMVTKTTSQEEFKILGVLGKLYVLMEGKEGLVMMDQHAAHERVLFEKMRYSMEREGVPSQRLLMPLMLHVSPRDYDC